MIEKDFTELDNDFITVWSKFILSSKKQLRSIKHDIERLAELGQVNAVQSYYLFLKQDDKSNEIIDKIVEGYPDTDFNYLQAKTNKLMKEENYEEYCKQFYNAERDALITGRPNKIKDIILNSRSFKLLCDTKKKCFEQYKQTNDPLILESFFEISLGSTPWPIKEERKIFKMYNIIRKQLLAKF
ncbi:MAG: hypothetical protein K2K31_02590, partial [Clostridia bacterium]|nr:hypothetical protein [Clostridia bacterium]